VAVSEAFDNVLLLSQRLGTPFDLLEIRFGTSIDALRISISRAGTNSEAAAAHYPDELLDYALRGLEAGGLGLFLIQTLMDEVEISGNGGTEITLTKRLPGRENSYDEETELFNNLFVHSTSAEISRKPNP